MNFSIFFKRATLFALLFFLQTKLIGQIFNIRALWIVRDYVTNEKEIDKIISFASENNYNNIFVQIRGRGDSYYNSKLVPKTHLLKNSKFDPLEYILKKAKGSKINIHAWMNVYYLWSSSEKPIQNDHLLINHPDWIDNKVPDQMNIGLMLEKMKKDRKINGEGFYLAPTHPEVDAHLQNVITELLQNYRLDGIHFDYIRYHDAGYGMNPTGLKFFLNYSNNIPGLPSVEIQDKPSFEEYKRNAITNFIDKASKRIRAYQPNCIISAAVKPNIVNAKTTFAQEWDIWLKKGYIDWAVPMNYTNENGIFERNINIMKDNLSDQLLNKIIMGIAAYNQSARSVGQKIYKTGKSNFGGFSIFSYTVFRKEPSYAKQLVKYIN
ncbi:MAG: hypothetical protein CMG60_04120 [Candidatus Marinimicrobia bacterium]|nr:hypothetical protein [Candidatus Neomarinimicrobiota bacterium]